MSDVAGTVDGDARPRDSRRPGSKSQTNRALVLAALATAPGHVDGQRRAAQPRHRPDDRRAADPGRVPRRRRTPN